MIFSNINLLNIIKVLRFQSLFINNFQFILSFFFLKKKKKKKKKKKQNKLIYNEYKNYIYIYIIYI